MRVAQIREQSVINEELETLKIDDSNKDNNKNENSSQAKQLGDEWLVSLRPSRDHKSIVSSAIETSTHLSPICTQLNHIHDLNLSISHFSANRRVDDKSPIFRQ